MREMYPGRQILPLDYDPDVSFANLENRLQMLIMNVKRKKRGHGCPAGRGAEKPRGDYE